MCRPRPPRHRESVSRIATAVAEWFPFDVIDAPDLLEHLAADYPVSLSRNPALPANRHRDLLRTIAPQDVRDLLERHELSPAARAWIVERERRPGVLSALLETHPVTVDEAAAMFARCPSRSRANLVGEYLRRPVLHGLRGTAAVERFLPEADALTRALWLAVSWPGRFGDSAAEVALARPCLARNGAQGAYLTRFLRARPDLWSGLLEDPSPQLLAALAPLPELTGEHLTLVLGLDDDIDLYQWTRKHLTPARIYERRRDADPVLAERIRFRLRRAGQRRGSAPYALSPRIEPGTDESSALDVFTRSTYWDDHVRDRANQRLHALDSCLHEHTIHAVSGQVYPCGARDCEVNSDPSLPFERKLYWRPGHTVWVLAQALRDVPDAWPVLFALADEWTGTLTELAATVRVLATASVSGSTPEPVFVA